jgi:hypothetical protein
LQAQFDQHQHQQHSIAQKLVVGAEVPPFLKITAKKTEQWAAVTQARSLLPVLLRKLVNSIQDLSLAGVHAHAEGGGQEALAEKYRN